MTLSVARTAPQKRARDFVERIPPPHRRAVLTALTASIRRVHSRAPHGWGLTLHGTGRKARLNAGPLEAFTILPKGVKLLVVGAAARATREQGTYSSLPEAAPRTVLFSEFRTEWGKLQKDHFAFLDRAAPPGRKYGWRRFHSEELIKRIETYLLEELPTPGYPADEGTPTPQAVDDVPGCLLLWNGRPENWPGREKDLKKFRRLGFFEGQWLCGRRREIPIGTRVFVKRTGPNRGIVASGNTTGPVKSVGPKDARERVVPVRFDAMVDPDSDQRLPQESLVAGPLAAVYWNTQSSGMRLPPEVVEALEEVWREHLALYGNTLSPQQMTQERNISVARRLARDSAFSRLVKSEGTGVCAACGHGRPYGEVNILEAAHIRAVEHRGPDALGNALLLCPNHHALFDQGYWTIGKRKRSIVTDKNMPRALKETFGEALVVPWPLNELQLEWHRTTVFLGRRRATGSRN